MSDLTATNCWMRMRKRKRNVFLSVDYPSSLLLRRMRKRISGNGFGNDSCLWIILLLCCCGGFGNNGCGC